MSQHHMQELETILDDDDDMADLYLTVSDFVQIYSRSLDLCTCDHGARFHCCPEAPQCQIEVGLFTFSGGLKPREIAASLLTSNASPLQSRVSQVWA